MLLNLERAKDRLAREYLTADRRERLASAIFGIRTVAP